jgi:hypothetical protein
MQLENDRLNDDLNSIRSDYKRLITGDSNGESNGFDRIKYWNKVKNEQDRIDEAEMINIKVRTSRINNMPVEDK